MRIWAICFAVSLSLLGLAGANSALAQSAPPGPPPPAVQDLVRILDDPGVRTWLDQAKSVPPTAAPPAVSIESAASAGLAGRLSHMREHLRSIAAAVPRLPEELSRAGRNLQQDMEGRGLFGTLLLFLIFVGFGYGSEFLFRRATAGRGPGSTLTQWQRFRSACA